MSELAVLGKVPPPLSAQMRKRTGRIQMQKVKSPAVETVAC